MGGYKFYDLIVIVKWNQPTQFCTQFFIIIIFSIALKFRTYHWNSLVITHLFAYCHTLLFPMAHTNPIVTHWCFPSLHNIPWVLPNKIVILGKWCVVVGLWSAFFCVQMENGELKLEQLLVYYRFSHMNLSYLGFALLHTISDIQFVKKMNCFCGN
jgi:hypothetical protein